MGTSKYNLEQLGWFNFEQLIRILFRELLGPGLSTFSGSVDQGRDATFQGRANRFPSIMAAWDGFWILQVKHRTYSSSSANATRKQLKRSLEDDVKKVTQKYHHSCHNYIFITNCPLTSADKDEMLTIINQAGPTIRNHHIIGETDLDELLDLNPKAVSTFPQIMGLSQLQDLLNPGLHKRSLEYLQAAQKEIATFVITSSYLKAIDLLHQQHFCVLSGSPKMGKTCTAYALASSFSALSYGICDLRKQKDFYDTYRKDEKQLFICDDVFGDISMLGSQRDEWARGFQRLLGSLGRNHKLIWTAREYILREALSSSKLEEDRPSLATTDKVTVAVDELSRLEKAMILYNHAKEASLPESIRKILKRDLCIGIVDHSNHSPESIRQLCSGRLVDFMNDSPDNIEEIRGKVNGFMSRPGEAWKNAYLAASSGERLLCTEVMASGGATSMRELRKRYETAMISTGDVDSFEKSFVNATGTFLRTRPHYDKETQIVQFYHPSMRDLLSELIEQDGSIRSAYLKQLPLKELPALVKQSNSIGQFGESSKHRIRIEDKQDIDLLRDHLNTTLLPQSDILEVLDTLTNLHTIIGQGQCRKGSTISSSNEYPEILWMILDCVVPHACSSEFWKNNASYSHIPHWRKLFKILRSLLPIISTPMTPSYVPQTIRKNSKESSVDFWGLVHAAHSIVPTIVEQCTDFNLRETCRTYLIGQVDNALNEAENYDLEDSYEESQTWYDIYGELPGICKDYAGLFPNDILIDQVDDLLQLVADFPQIEDESDGESEYYEPVSTSLKDRDILDIFSDL